MIEQCLTYAEKATEIAMTIIEENDLSKVLGINRKRENNIKECFFFHFFFPVTHLHV